MITTQSKLMQAEKDIEALQFKNAELTKDYHKLSDAHADLLKEYDILHKELHATYDKLDWANRSWWSKLFS